MARVLIFHQSPILYMGSYQTPVFYEGLIQELIKSGNDVFHFITSDFLVKAWNGSNKPYRAAVKQHLHASIKDFEPDLILSFNNSCVEGIEDLVECPIALWNADSVTFFNDKDNIRKNPERYLYLSFSERGIQDYIDCFSAPKKNIFKMRFATAVRSQKMDQDYNISFIGTNFQLDRDLSRFLKTQPEEAKRIIRLSRENSIEDLRSHINNLKLEEIGVTVEKILNINSGSDRTQILSTVAPLGLHLFGDMGWDSICDYSIDTFLSFNPALVYTLKHNATIYNRSKVSISVSHAQNVTEYPWRITDIMASNAVLVADKKQDIIDDFGKKVPLQLYETPLEAYNITSRLLRESSLRQEIVEASQLAINAGFRWHHRFKDLEQIISTNLIIAGKQGTYKRYSPESVGRDIFLYAADSIFKVQQHRQKTNMKIAKKGFLKRLAAYVPKALLFHLVKKYKSRFDRPLYK